MAKNIPSIKMTLTAIVVSIITLSVGWYATSIYKLSKYPTQKAVKMMFDMDGNHADAFYPPYAYEVHIYMFRGNQKAVETIKSMGGISIFFAPYGPNSRPEMRKRIAKFYLK